MVETSLNRIMNGIVHDDVFRRVYRLQLLDSRSEAAADTSCHDT